MTSNIPEKIIKYLEENNQATVKEMVVYFDISKQGLFRHLNKMVASNQLRKIGKPPKVFYLLAEEVARKNDDYPDKTTLTSINKNFLYITPKGQMLTGWDGFKYWCIKKKNEPKKTAFEYIETLNRINSHFENSLISGKDKFRNTFVENLFLDEVYYLDFYSIERFGKTKLGQLLLYGKQSGNRQIIKQVIESTKDKINNLIKEKNIDAVLFVPWTVKREVQFMKELELGLNLPLPKIQIEKIKTDVVVPQKSLNKLEDRVDNAHQTMLVIERNKYSTVLIIDDAVGSGATLNEIAGQLKKKSLADKVIGLALTGSYKGFDVISEV